MIDRFKDRFLKVFDTRLDAIDARAYVDDEFVNLYESIGMDLPDPDAAPKKRLVEHRITLLSLFS
jgi:hypothetical protein